MTITPNAIAAHWGAVAAAGLPAEERVRERNAAITATYARWYASHPQLLKWAGAAAFVSHRVGLALVPYEVDVIEDRAIQLRGGAADGLGPEVLLQDLDLLRRTNNLIFADIGWAHAAFVAPDGGLAAVEEGLSEQPTHALMRAGFREIERGRVLLAGSAANRRQARAHVWRGNALLLRHEQLVTVQRQFEQLHLGLRVFLSVMTALDFDARELAIEFATHTSFHLFMWTAGLGVLLRTRSLPDIAKPTHRWFWVHHRVLPIWRKVDRREVAGEDRAARAVQPDLPRNLTRLVLGPTNPFGRSRQTTAVRPANPPLTSFAAPFFKGGDVLIPFEKGGRRAAAGGFACASWRSRCIDLTNGICGSRH